MKNITLSDDDIIGGVVGGIAEHFGIDPTILRILTVIVFLYGTQHMALLYLILWAIMPDK